MKKYILMVATLALLGCHTTREAVTVRETVHDTVRLTNVQYDSIFIDRWSNSEVHGDTLYRERVQTEYRLRLVHDTTYVHRRDTIPVVTYIDRPTPYVPWYAKSLAWFGLGSFVILILKVLWKRKIIPFI